MPTLFAIALAALCIFDPPATVEVSKDRLLASLRAIPTRRAATGSAADREGLNQTESWLQAELKTLGITPTIHEFEWTSRALEKALNKERFADADPTPTEKPPTWRNYIVDFPGTDLARETLILGAHYDAVEGTPGADDDASGVVALLEIARVLKGRPARRTIRLVFFTLEEVGLVGAREYVKANHPKWQVGPEGKPPEEKIIGMVSVEMIGYFTDEPASQKSPIPKIGGKPIVNVDVPNVGNFIALATVSRHKPFNRRLAQEMLRGSPDLHVVTADMFPIAPPDFLRSDHAPFLTHAIPAVMMTDTADFRNPNYHKPTDTVESLDSDRLTKVVRALAFAAHAIADGDAIMPLSAPPTPDPSPPPQETPAEPAPK